MNHVAELQKNASALFIKDGTVSVCCPSCGSSFDDTVGVFFDAYFYATGKQITISCQQCNADLKVIIEHVRTVVTLNISIEPVQE